MKPLPALRYLAALLVTLCILPAWARVYVTPMVFGAVEPLYLGTLLAGLGRVEFAWRTAKRADYAGPKKTTAPAPVANITISDASADDWPQYLGPHRSGVAAGGIRLADWTEQPPNELWRIPVGPGWSGFAVVSGYAFTQEQRGNEECVCCYRMNDGSPAWRHAESARFESAMGGDGPRATPTVSV